MGYPKVFIIILNWNGLNDTLECLESVFKLTYEHFEVVVVDNGSTNDSVAVIRKAYPGLNLIENKINLGYTGGNNIGIRYAIGRSADYIWLLNNDTIVEPETLGHLVAVAERSPDVGLVSPVIYYYNDPDKIQYSGSYIDWKKFLFPNVKNRERLRIETTNRNIFLWGTALFVKRSVVDSVGYLSDKYFAYWEDAEYSVRTAKGGYRNVIAYGVRVYHKDSGSTGGRESPIQLFLRLRNSYFFWMGNLKGFRRISYFRKYMADAISYAAAFRNEGLNECAEACLGGAWSAIWGIGGPWNSNVKIPFLMKQISSWHPYFWAGLLRGEIIKLTSEMFRRTMARIFENILLILRLRFR